VCAYSGRFARARGRLRKTPRANSPHRRTRDAFVDHEWQRPLPMALVPKMPDWRSGMDRAWYSSQCSKSGAVTSMCSRHNDGGRPCTAPGTRLRRMPQLRSSHAKAQGELDNPDKSLTATIPPAGQVRGAELRL
jgi:hypothetical protein